MALLTALSLLFAFSCATGYTGRDGDSLKRYLPPAELKALTEAPDPGILIIDVRPAAAYRQGHIPGAVSIPSGEVDTRLAEIPRDKGLILYCETGGRAQMVIKKLEKNGYTRLLNWGGFTRWPYPAAEGD
jgi:rhodanese-related sulfurtransferase